MKTMFALLCGLSIGLCGCKENWNDPNHPVIKQLNGHTDKINELDETTKGHNGRFADHETRLKTLESSPKQAAQNPKQYKRVNDGNTIYYVEVDNTHRLPTAAEHITAAGQVLHDAKTALAKAESSLVDEQAEEDSEEADATPPTRKTRRVRRSRAVEAAPKAEPADEEESSDSGKHQWTFREAADLMNQMGEAGEAYLKLRNTWYKIQEKPEVREEKKEEKKPSSPIHDHVPQKPPEGGPVLAPTPTTWVPMGGAFELVEVPCPPAGFAVKRLADGSVMAFRDEDHPTRRYHIDPTARWKHREW